MYIKRLFLLIVLILCFVIITFADKLEERLQDIRAFRDHKLTTQEQQILDHLNGLRTVKGIDLLEADLNLCEAMRGRMQKIINDKDALDTASTADRLLEFMSYLGGETFLIKGRSIQEVLDNIGQNTALCGELVLSDNIKLGFCSAKDTLADYLYSAIYLTKYYIEFFPQEARSFLSPSGATVTWFMNPNGKTNAKYIKYILYPSNMLPFYYTGEYIFAKEFQTDEDGFFSLRVSFSIGNHDIGRRAIFAKESEEEPYSLIQFAPM